MIVAVSESIFSYVRASAINSNGDFYITDEPVEMNSDFLVRHLRVIVAERTVTAHAQDDVCIRLTELGIGNIEEYRLTITCASKLDRDKILRDLRAVLDAMQRF